MTEPSPGPVHELPHLVVPHRGSDVTYRGKPGGGGGKVRAVEDRGGHAQALKEDLTEARDYASASCEDVPQEVRAEGFTIWVESWSDQPGYGLALDSLATGGAKLLAVHPKPDAKTEDALVWMPWGAEEKFLRKLEAFATENTANGKPKNEKLVANIKELSLSILEQYWQEADPFPRDQEERWWEVWFAPSERTEQDIEAATSMLGLRMAPSVLIFPEGTIAAVVQATPQRLSGLLTTNCVVSEVHWPPSPAEFTASGTGPVSAELVADLTERIEPAPEQAPAVCLLDTGINRHRLLSGSVDQELSALSKANSADEEGHGTKMAGLALFADSLPAALASQDKVELQHRLESVKILHSSKEDPRNAEPPFYGVVMAQAVSRAELGIPNRRRIFSTQITSKSSTSDGRPTSWSASIDAVAFGSDIAVSDRGISLLGLPDPSAGRLICVSAGNTFPYGDRGDYLLTSDTSPSQDPAQAWNVLTVGAYTGLTSVHDPNYQDYSVLADEGELSPHSTTSRPWAPTWPLAPDIVMEGGNLIVDPGGQRWEHGDLQLLTTGNNGGLIEANATSAATAQAARLGALALARYPKLWPETVRGLLVHSAEWTAAMRAQLTPKKLTKKDKVQVLRRYGWGVPSEARVLASAENHLTMIVEDEFLPFEFDKNNVAIRALRLHELPWPRDLLLDLGETQVELRVTLSYFVEPNPSNRGWVRYRYPSHQLRFDLKRPTETPAAFRDRVTIAARAEEDNKSPRTAGHPSDVPWLIGTGGRSRGSLHADVWTGDAASLAECGRLAVVPVGGWWKENKRADRISIPIRYALLVSLKTTTGIDLYTPIAQQIGIKTAIET